MLISPLRKVSAQRSLHHNWRLGRLSRLKTKPDSGRGLLAWCRIKAQARAGRAVQPKEGVSRQRMHRTVRAGQRSSRPCKQSALRPVGGPRVPRHDVLHMADAAAHHQVQVAGWPIERVAVDGRLSAKLQWFAVRVQSILLVDYPQCNAVALDDLEPALN